MRPSQIDCYGPLYCVQSKTGENEMHLGKSADSRSDIKLEGTWIQLIKLWDGPLDGLTTRLYDGFERLSIIRMDLLVE